MTMQKYTLEIMVDPEEFDKDSIEEKLKMLADFKIIKITKKANRRSDQQNKAMHAYFRLLAQAMVDKNIDLKTALSEDVEHQVTPKIVKHQMWAKIQEAEFNTDSTTKLKSYECTKVHEILNNYTANQFKINIPFPSEINMREGY